MGCPRASGFDFWARQSTADAASAIGCEDCFGIEQKRHIESLFQSRRRAVIGLLWLTGK
jgi:hypothetical protein